MNRHVSLTSLQAGGGDKFNDSSQHLNVTLKDVNLEARKILRKTLLKENGEVARKERDIYLSGPCFPCQNYKLKRSLRKSWITSVYTTESEHFANGLRTAKTRLNVPVREQRQNMNEDVPREVKVLKDCDDPASTMKVPTICVNDLAVGQQASKLSEPEAKQRTTKTSEKCLQQEITSDEFKNTKLLKTHIDKAPSSSDTGREAKFSKGEQFERNSKEYCSHQDGGNSRSSRRPSQQIKPSPSRGATPVFEGRRLSSVSNENGKSTSNLKSKHIPKCTNEFALDHISNPLLRESLKKILNSHSYVENTTANTTRQKTAPLQATHKLFEDEISLPDIRRRFRHRSSDIGSKRSGGTNDSFNGKSKRSAKVVRFAENRPTPELSSTKWTGFKMTRNHPVRMLSPGSEYPVKGLIGQWLKRRPRSTDQTEKQSVEKQESYREVQLLKVGLSMRLLAGIA